MTLTSKPDIDLYLAVPDTGSPSFSADGTHLAFVSDIAGSMQAWIVELEAPDSSPRALTDDAQTDRVETVKFAPVGDRLLLVHDRGGDEQMQLSVLEPTTSRITPLTADHAHAKHGPGEWAADAGAVLLSSNRREKTVFDVYLQPLDGSPARCLWQQNTPGGIGNLRFSPDGKRALATRRLSNAHVDLFEIDMEAATVSQLNAPDVSARFEDVHYDADGFTLIARTDLLSDFMQLARFDRGSGAWSVWIAEEWDIDGLALSPDRRRLAYTVNANGESHLILHDRDAQSTHRLPTIDESPAVISSLEFSSDGAALAFSRSAATSGIDIHVWNTDTGAVRSVGVARLKPNVVTEGAPIAPGPVSFPTFDGRAIPAWCYRPHHAERPDGGWPAVVFIHGGPESQYRPRFDFFLQYLTQRGYVVLAPNVRGSTGYGKTYSHLDDRDRRFDALADVAHANAWLKRQPDVDAQRIAVYGRSYGGFMTLATLAHQPGLWTAGVEFVGMSNLVTFLENTSAYRRAMREAEYGWLDRDRAFLEKISPIFHVERMRAPLFVSHGRNDPRVPVSETEQMVEILRGQGVAVETCIFDDEGHGITKHRNKRVAYERAADFLDRHLCGD